MGKIYPLDAVMKRISCSRLKKRYLPSERLVIIDVDNKKIIKKKPWVSWREIRCYRISTENTAVNEILNHQIKDISTNRTIYIDITYKVSCQIGKEDQVVKQLLDGDNPAEMLDIFIKQWIQKFVRNKKITDNDFITNYFSQKNELKKYLENKIEGLGLLLVDIGFLLKNEHKINKPLQLKSQIFEVRVSDYSSKLNLQIKNAMLHVYEKNKINILATDEQELKLIPLIQEKISIFFRENITLHNFLYRMNHDNFIKNIMQHINEELLEERGRNLVRLSLDSSDISSLRLDESSFFKYEIEYKIKDHSEFIRIEHNILMNLYDIGEYKLARIDDLEIWVKNKLEKITQSILLEKTYADLILKLDEIVLKIKQEIEKQSKCIGYSVTQLHVAPDLDPFTLKRDGIYLKNKKGKFLTNDTRIKAKLNISIRADVDANFGKMKDYLHPNVNILKEIKRVAFEQAQIIINNIEPERFYMRFNFSSHNELSVEEELIQSIKEKLKNNFSLQNIVITPKADQKNDKLAKRFQKLQEGFHDFEVNTSPIREGGYEEPIKLSGQFEIYTVNNWHTFQIKNYKSLKKEISDIREAIERNIKTTLDTIPSDYIRFKDSKVKKQILKITQYSAKEVGKQFGLTIKISHVGRSLSASEKLNKKIRISHNKRAEEELITSDKMAQKTNEVNLQTVEILHKKHLEALDDDLSEDNEEIETIEKRLENIVKNKPSYSTSSETKPQLEKLKPTEAKEFSWDEYYKDTQQDMLPPTKTTERIEDITGKNRND